MLGMGERSFRATIANCLNEKVSNFELYIGGVWVLESEIPFDL